MEKQKASIGFIYENASGSYMALSTLTIDRSIGSEIDEIGRQLSVFLNQIGYLRPNGHIFMEDVTEDEAAALEGFLDDYRRRKVEQ